MTVSYSNYVRVWIWQSNAVNPPVCSHVALETVQNGQSTYMSCRWQSKDAYKFIFSKKDDDVLEAGKTAVSYDLVTLNVEKINRAYKRYSNSTAGGSLYWRILHPGFPKNSAQLTAYLLKEGGIESFYLSKQMEWIEQFLTRITDAGLFFWFINLLSAYQFGRIAHGKLIEPGNILSYEQGHRRLALSVINTGYTAVNVIKLAFEFAKRNPILVRCEAVNIANLAIANLAADTIKLSGIFSKEIWFFLSLTAYFRSQARECQKKMFQLADRMAYISYISSLLLLFFQKFFMHKPLNSIGDIEWFVIKTVEKEERHMINPFYSKILSFLPYIRLGLMFASSIAIEELVKRNNYLNKHIPGPYL